MHVMTLLSPPRLVLDGLILRFSLSIVHTRKVVLLNEIFMMLT